MNVGGDSTGSFLSGSLFGIDIKLLSFFGGFFSVFAILRNVSEVARETGGHVTRQK
jgi:hypothetical protein